MRRRYNGYLVDWISSVLKKDKLETIVSAIKNKDKISNIIADNFETNKLYLAKILREEITKQFKGAYRPVVEVVLNSLDSREHSQTDHKVDIKLGNKKIVVTDNGSGMGIEEILKFLIVPFNTEKEGINEIGRFGVGFFSLLSYCLMSSRIKVIVETSLKKEAYRITFYTKKVPGTIEHEISDIFMVIDPIRRKTIGTTILVNHFYFTRNTLEHALISDLHTIPSYTSKISINGEVINNRSNVKYYKENVVLTIRGNEYKQAVSVGISTDDINRIVVTAHGVNVISKKIGTLFVKKIQINFPPAIRVVEGRDEFKIDDNYYLCIEAATKCLLRYLKDQQYSEHKYRVYILDILSTVATCFGIENASDFPNAEKIIKEDLPNSKYLVPLVDWQGLKEFIEDNKNEAIPCVHSVYTFWSPLFKMHEQFLSDHVTYGLEMDTSIAHRFLCAGSFDNIKDCFTLFFSEYLRGASKVIIVYCKKAGISPFYLTYDYKLLINAGHPSVTGAYSHEKNLYNNFCLGLRACDKDIKALLEEASIKKALNI